MKRLAECWPYLNGENLEFISIDKLSEIYDPRIYQMEYLHIEYVEDELSMKDFYINGETSGRYYVIIKLTDTWNNIVKYYATDIEGSRRKNISSTLLYEYGLKIISPTDEGYKSYLGFI